MLEVFTVFGMEAAALAGALVILWGLNRLGTPRNASRAWRDAGKRLRLDHTPISMGGTLSGELEGLDVFARGGMFQDGQQTRFGTDIEVSGGISPSLRATPGGGLDYRNLFRAENARAADPAEAMAVAVLTPETRAGLSERLRALGAHVENGAVRIRRSSVMADADAIAAHVRGAAELGRALSVRGQPLEERLFDAMQREPLPDRRAHLHKVLLAGFADTQPGQRALELAEDASDPELRLLRALHVPHGRFAALAALASAAAVRGPLRAEAIEHLCALDDEPRVTALLRKLLSDPDRHVRRAAIRGVQRFRDDALLDALLALAADPEPGLELELIACLQRLGSARAEPVLIAHLRAQDQRVRAAAVGALRRIGTVAAVAPLLALAEAGDADARAAIDTIQARLGDVEAGRLSVVQSRDEEGALSLARPSGELAFAPEGERDEGEGG